MEKFGIWVIGIAVLCIILSVVAVYLITRAMMKKFREEQQLKADNVIVVAKEKAQKMEIEAREKALVIVQNAEKEVDKRRMEIDREDERLLKRRNDLDKRVERLETRELTLNKRQSSLDRKANEVDRLYSQEMEELQRIAQMTDEEAKKELFIEVEKDARSDMARIIRQIENEAKNEGEKRAREIISNAIQRVASDHVSEVSTSVVSLPNEEMKGRIVGRNGRNIRAFEQAAGVDVIVDDTPEAVTISCFDSVRREIARRSLERLILDGRIHPAYIEKVLGEEEREIEKAIAEAGEQAAFDAGVAGLRIEVLKKMGRLKFRTSYGQNQLAHAVENCPVGRDYCV